MNVVVSMGKSIWLVDGDSLEEGKFVGVMIISDIEAEEPSENE